MLLSEIIKSLDVELEIISDAEFESLGFVTHQRPKQLAYLEDAKFLPALLKNTSISAVLTTEALASSIHQGVGTVITANPRKSFYEIHNYLAGKTVFYRQPFDRQIASSAHIHPTAYVAPTDVRIGERCEIGPQASILEGSIIEDDVSIGAGCVVGINGWEFNRIEGEVLPVVHAGGVKIHRGVEMLANCCIAKAMFGDFTEIGEDTKLNNLIHIAHGTKIGKRCLIAACATITGSVTIGDDVWVGPSATISSEVVIGDGASITIGAVVTKDVAPGQRVTGNFAIDHDKFIALMRKIR